MGRSCKMRSNLANETLARNLQVGRYEQRVDVVFLATGGIGPPTPRGLVLSSSIPHAIIKDARLMTNKIHTPKYAPFRVTRRLDRQVAMAS